MLRSRADHSYGYADALADGVVRPVVFLAYSGEASWRTSAGEEMTARLGEPLTAEQNARAWRTALDPKGEWMPAVLQAADTRLTQLRAGGVPDAGGLVIATDHTTAKAYAALLRRVAGEEPVVVLSDDPKASGRIAEFGRHERALAGRRPHGVRGRRRPAAGRRRLRHQRLDAAVLRAGRRPLRPVPAAGGDRERVPPERAVAARRWPASSRCSATTSSASRTGRRRAGRTTSSRRPTAPRTSRASRRRRSTSLSAEAELDQLIYDGSSFGTAACAGSAEEQDYLGLPGLLEPDQVRALLRRRQSEQLDREEESAAPARGGPGAVPVAGPRVPS